MSGYTPAVADYLEGMRVVRWCHAYMLPRDGGKPAPWHALGLTEGEYAELARRIDMRETEPQAIPNSRAEDCVRWVTGAWSDRDENLRKLGSPAIDAAIENTAFWNAPWPWQDQAPTAYDAVQGRLLHEETGTLRLLTAMKRAILTKNGTF